MTTFIQQQNELREDEDETATASVKWTVWTILCKTTIVGWFFTFAFALIVPVLTYYLVVNLGTYKEVDTFTCFVNSTFRVPCGKVNISEHDCVKLACCYDKPTDSCYHYLPSRYSYDLAGSSYKASRSSSPFNTTAVEEMQISVNEISINKVSIILHKPSTSIVENTVNVREYVVKKAAEKLMVEIFRPNGDRIFSTAKGPLIASENYWEWTVHLTDHSLFGLDKTLLQRHKNSTISKVFYKNKNDHSNFPVIWAYHRGQFHGLTVKHDGPLEVSILTSNLIILKGLLGETIELVLYTGPTPADLHQQHLEDSEQLDVPEWLLKTHMCRKNEKFLNVSTLVSNFVLDSEADSFCIDENLLMGILAERANDTSYQDSVQALITPLREKGKKFLLSVPPQVLTNSDFYNNASSLDLLYTYLNKTIYQGKYLDQDVSYIDYSHENIQKYMEVFGTFLEDFFNHTIDGLVLTDNWPANEEFKMDNDSFPYFTKALQDAMSYTIQWNTTANDILHIQKHNSYGGYQYKSLKDYFKSKEIFILSATKSISQVEPMIIENVETSWTNLRKYLDSVLFDSIIGNHLVSIPVCGDTNVFDTSIQMKLCLRWYLIAATMPMFRISAPKPWRNPDDLSAKYDQQTAQSALDTRNMLLAYYNGLISSNEPVIRPMFYDFYENTTTFSLYEQYMVGKNMLVVHPLTADRTKMNVYLPPAIDVWYEFWGGDIYKPTKINPWVSISVTEADFVAFIPKGSVIPLIDGNTVNLIVALNFTSSKRTRSFIESSGSATGFMKTDGISITFTANLKSVDISSSSDKKWSLHLGYVKVYQYLNSNNPAYYDVDRSIDQDTQNMPYEPPPTTITESTTSTMTTSTTTTSTVTESTTEDTGTTSSSTPTMESTTEDTGTTSRSTPIMESTTGSTGETDSTSPISESTTEDTGTTSISTPTRESTTEDTGITSTSTPTIESTTGSTDNTDSSSLISEITTANTGTTSSFTPTRESTTEETGTTNGSTATSESTTEDHGNTSSSTPTEASTPEITITSSSVTTAKSTTTDTTRATNRQLLIGKY
uniref:Probable maltase-glucoamylase 2 isoform X1 n=1 Tax=Diabrotica virgifera virgifera TaxID=50390 RepID=A0A6P7EZQ0_DIAVI